MGRSDPCDKRLGDTFDELLGRLQSSFEAQRRFVANASHELRTPLTLERTLLEVALANPDAGAASLRTTCEKLLAVGREQERLLEALLTLASTERGLDHREPLSLDELTGRALLTRRPEIEQGSLTLSSALEPFERFENGRSGEPDGHHGLGLSIVRAIAVAHDATVSAQPLAGGELAVTVAFPAASH